jgi:hypothetical protein
MLNADKSCVTISRGAGSRAGDGCQSASSPGNTSANTLLIRRLFAMRSAVPWLSPVSMRPRRRARSALIASTAVALLHRQWRSNPRACRPQRDERPTLQRRAIPRILRQARRGSILFSVISSLLPRNTVLPSISACAPLPPRLLNPVDLVAFTLAAFAGLPAPRDGPILVPRPPRRTAVDPRRRDQVPGGAKTPRRPLYCQVGTWELDLDQCPAVFSRQCF